MRCIPHYALIDRGRFLLMGGLGSGSLLIILSMFVYNQWWIFTPLFTIGLINLLYGPFEMLYKDRMGIDNYMKMHYVLYLLVGLIGLILSHYIAIS